MNFSDFEAIVKLSDGFNGADLRNVCTEAGMYQSSRERDVMYKKYTPPKKKSSNHWKWIKHGLLIFFIFQQFSCSAFILLLTREKFVAFAAAVRWHVLRIKGWFEAGCYCWCQIKKKVPSGSSSISTATLIFEILSYKMC